MRVARITGEGPVLLVTPSALSCNGSLPGLVDCGGRLEGWRPLRDDPAPRGVAFEGFYSWAFLTRAWAEAEWAAAQPWNEPTSLVLRAGESAVFSLRLSTVPAGLDAVDAALAAAGLPFARASPGTVLPADMTAAHLLVRPPSPAGGATFALDGVAVDPPFAIAVGSPAPVNSSGGGLLSLPLAPAAGATGRARITLRFSSPALPAAPPLLLTAHFLLLPPLPRQAQRLGAFASGPAWLNAAAAGSDPFGRVFAFGHWDAAAGAVTLQESRAWVAGLSDESGAAMALAAASLTAARPDDDGAALALAQLATYANRTLRGTKRNGAGEQTSLQQADGGVRASMFFSGMPNFSYSVAPCWDEPRSLTTWRAYNYPHQVMVQLYLYRVVRDAPCTLARAAGIAAASGGALDAPPPWQESLRGAAATHAAMWTHSGPGEPFFLSQYGLMVGGGHADLLDALAEEATAAGPGGGEWAPLLATANAVQVARAEIWGNLSFPYGSEMPWDSTGQEELYTFAMRLGDDTLAQRTLAAVKAYTPDATSSSMGARVCRRATLSESFITTAAASTRPCCSAPTAASQTSRWRFGRASLHPGVLLRPLTSRAARHRWPFTPIPPSSGGTTTPATQGRISSARCAWPAATSTTEPRRGDSSASAATSSRRRDRASSSRRLTPRGASCTSARLAHLWRCAAPAPSPAPWSTLRRAPSRLRQPLRAPTAAPHRRRSCASRSPLRRTRTWRARRALPSQTRPCRRSCVGRSSSPGKAEYPQSFSRTPSEEAQVLPENLATHAWPYPNSPRSKRDHNVDRVSTGAQETTARAASRKHTCTLAAAKQSPPYPASTFCAPRPPTWRASQSRLSRRCRSRCRPSFAAGPAAKSAY